eukprot:TRINITY_DN4442_c0_g1_i2.p1 TRINITY_DN4442_c0_g1~~TRINITY_DN4442_c0_g1_i2.p1  ORF type:complete len:500 (-),score=62.91 TRINITY_DN4442_c0_g1_i2:152-1549(-)
MMKNPEQRAHLALTDAAVIPADVEPPPETVRFRISKTIKSVKGDEIVDRSLADVLSASGVREDKREADTPLGNTKTAKPKSPFPKFQDKPSSKPRVPQFNLDSIATPHTYAAVHTSDSPRISVVGNKIFHLLRRTWQDSTSTFSYRSDPAAVAALAQDTLQLCTEVSVLLQAEPVYLKLPPNVFVIGDIHGNYSDLNYFIDELLLFNDITMTPYSFLSLGDYVDRGEYSFECVMLFFSLKALSPTTFYMIRGNHEDPGINGDVDTYGADCFLSQCRAVFGEELGTTVWTACNDVFKYLPLAACIADQVFCSHGGIPRYYGPPDSDDRITLLSSPEFPRFRSLFEPLDMSVLGKERMERFWVAAFDLMWSDPSEDDSEMNEFGFGRNDRGNCIITFSEVAVDNFLRTHGMDLMFRAHQEKSDGLKLSKSAKCLTIFSSSNYQGHGNGAGVVYVSITGRVRMIMKEA